MIRFTSLTLALFACGGDLPAIGQFGEDEALECVLVSESSVGSDEIVTLLDDQGAEQSVTAAELSAAVLAGPHTTEIAWGDQVTERSDLTVGVLEASGSVVRVEYEARSDGEEVDSAAQNLCSPRLRVPVSITMSSADGRLNETFDDDLVLSIDGSWVSATIDSPAGTVDPMTLYEGTDPIDAAAIQVHMSFQGTFSGSITPLRTDDPNDDVQTIGHWPLESEQDQED